MNAQLDLLSVAAAADLLGLSRRQVYRLCATGRFGTLIPQSGYVITRAELARFRRDRAREITKRKSAAQVGRPMKELKP